MIESNHKLKTGATGIVGYVVGKGEAHIALDVNMDEVHFKESFVITNPFRNGAAFKSR